LEQAAGSIAGHALPLLTGVTTTLLDLVLIFVLSIYLVVDGPRLIGWMRTAAPVGRMRGHVQFFVDTVQRNVGGYMRGQFLLAVLIGVLVGLGMAAFREPFALLLGVVAFALEFIPILGTLVSGAICVLIALPTRGVLIAVLVLAYFVIVHIVEGDVVGPRIVSHVLGLHPAVAILALLAGSELFGIWGALFASPVAGVIQTIFMRAWSEWRAAAEQQAPVRAGSNPDRPGPSP
jgi:predicted PurR-regulated permease PerM